MTRLAAFVITYARPAVAAAAVDALLAQTRPPERIAVLDNGRSPGLAERLRPLRGAAVAHVDLGGNLGPAGAAAHGLGELAGAGADWIYWGDDDDPPQTPDTLERLLRLAMAAGDDVAAVGAVGSRFDWRRGVAIRPADEELHGVVEVDVIAGSSQLLVRAAAVTAVGVPDARLFFGFEEPEYCLRLRRAGLRLLVDGDLHREYRRLANRLGDRPQRRWLPVHGRATLWRRYYSTRNYIHVMRNTFGRPDLARREAGRACLRSAAALARGPGYAAAFLRHQWLAVVDGYRGRLGRTVEPPRAEPAAASHPGATGR